ncbi:MAG: hypothetical protein GWP69_15925 [Gammaproteobacteria bacterium]|nr:hypothetical protein [Gammaproteobacteria bacterium]
MTGLEGIRYALESAAKPYAAEAPLDRLRPTSPRLFVGGVAAEVIEVPARIASSVQGASDVEIAKSAEIKP